MQGYGSISLDQMELRVRDFISQVYGWMAGGLALTALIAMWIAGNQQAVIFLATHSYLVWILILVQLGLVFAIGSARLSGATATILFIIYSASMGVMMSSIFLIYTKTSIALAFFSTAGMFAVMAIYGYTTKTDLTRIGNILLMALIGLVIASIVNIFLHSSGLQFILSILGVIIFSGLTAYDNQKIKQIGTQAVELGEDVVQKLAINGALALYLDFINLFLFLLQFLGKERD